MGERKRQVTAVLVCLLSFGSTNSLRPIPECESEPPCSCTWYPESNYAVLDCSYMNLTSVPRFGPSTVLIARVDLSNNNIRRLEAFAFANLSLASSVDIDLNQNPIEVVNELAFSGLVNSVNLHLRSTHLEKSPKALTGFNNLSSLNTDLPLDPNVSAELGSLKKLYLYKGSSAQSLNGTCNLPNLQFLYMTSVSFPPDVSPFAQCSQPMTSLRYAYFYHMNLPVVQKVAKNFPSLKGLSVSYGEVYAVSDDMILPNLTFLGLSHNKLKWVPWLTGRFQRLQNLDLSYNRISVILSGSFSGLHDLTHLDLSGNPISVIAEDTFKATPKLTHIGLYNGNLTTVPQAVRHLKQAYTDLSSNPIECTCDLGWLRPIVTAGDISISGFCRNEQHTITSYVSMYVLGCHVQPIG